MFFSLSFTRFMNVIGVFVVYISFLSLSVS
jgi:hypothetical protein